MPDEDSQDERHYVAAAAELDGGKRNEGLWAKCFAECDGDEQQAKVSYIKIVVERLISESPEEDEVGNDPEESENKDIEKPEGQTKQEYGDSTPPVIEDPKITPVPPIIAPVPPPSRGFAGWLGIGGSCGADSGCGGGD